MPQRKGLTSPQNTFLDTIATRFDGTHSNFVLGNAQSKDFPIVYCSDGFVELTGYSRAQIMSKSCSCSFLWGEKTGSLSQQEIQEALLKKSEFKTEVVLYKKDGQGFLCLLDIVPIKNEKDQVVLFLVSHKNLTGNIDSVLPMDQLDIECGYNQKLEVDDEESESSKDEASTSDKYQRRRSRAVLYQLSGQYRKRQKSKLKCLNFGKLRPKRSVPEYKVQEAKSYRLIVLHYSLFKIIWDWLILLCTFYVAIFVPYNVVFREERNLNFVMCDISVEVLFSIDIVLNFRTTYVNKAGQVVYDPRNIAKNYVTGWFLLDLAAALPFDTICNVEFKFSPCSSVIQMMKLARLLRLIRLIQKIDRYAQYSFVLLALLMCAFALCAHWMACIWYLIGRKQLNDDRTRTTNWLWELAIKTQKPYGVNETGGPNIDSIYISSLYFTCTSITSVGFGNVAPTTDVEKIFSICAMLVGALMHAAIFGNVTAIIQRMYSRKTNYQTKNQDLKDFIRVHHIPRSLKQRMFEFFQTNWAINRGIEPQEILKDFPEEMRGEISLHLNKEIMSLNLFEKASNACKKSLAQQIKTMFATPGEFLLHRGDVIKYLFFVCSGSLEILDIEGSVVALLGKFDLFGPEESCHPTRSRFDVRALTYCELQCLKLDCVEPLFEQYPEFKAHFTCSISDELSFIVSENELSQTEINEHTSDINETTDVLFLPAISEKEEDTKSDQSSPKSSVNDSFNDDFYIPQRSPPILKMRRSSQPERITSFIAPLLHARERSNSLPTDTSANTVFQRQLDQISVVNSNLSTQILTIQRSIERLSEEVRSICTALNDRNGFHNISNLDSPLFETMQSSQSKLLSHSAKILNHTSAEPRVKFDLHPQEIEPNESQTFAKRFSSLKNRNSRFGNSILSRRSTSYQQ